MRTLLVTLTMCLLALPANAKYSGGTGEPNDPYQIATAADLIALGETPADYDKHFILTADIDLDPNLPGRKVFDKAVIAWTRGSPGGMLGTPFRGTFDGDGHTVMHLTTADGYFLGLFGRLTSGGKIENVGIMDVYVSGTSSGPLVARNDGGDVLRCHSTGVVNGTGNSVGGLVGRNRGSLTDCYSTCTVSGHGDVGGLVGENDGTVTTSHCGGRVNGINGVGGLVGRNTGSLTDCCSTCTVSGHGDVGGLVGDNNGSIAESYTTCSVTGDSAVGGLAGTNAYHRIIESYSTGTVSGRTWVGGLVGFNEYASITFSWSSAVVIGEQCVGGLLGYNDDSPRDTNDSRSPASLIQACFWDTEASGQATGAGGTGKTTAEMQTASTFLDAGWDFVGETGNGVEDVWKIAEGLGYPRLAWEKYSGGTGEPNDPYQIATAADLIALGDTPDDYDKHFILTADIDLDPNLPGRKVFDKAVIAPDTDPCDTEPRSRGAHYGFFTGLKFAGVFDGNNRTISHLMVRGKSYVGLFGNLGGGAQIKNLRIMDVDLIGTGTGEHCVGGLAGANSGSISSSYVTGTVYGGSSVGGLVGVNSASIAASYSDASVGGQSSVGGLVGTNFDSITSSCSMGTVSGQDMQVGGLVGQNYHGSITSSCSVGAVSGQSYVGGLVGENEEYGSIIASYSHASVSGEDYVGGLVGNNEIHTRIAKCYSTGSVSGTTHVGGLVGQVNGTYITISASYWDIQTSGQISSAGNLEVGMTTDEMMDPYMLGLNGFANDPNWVLDAGRDYPRLAWEDTAGQMIPEPEIDWLAGRGTAEIPYQIDTAAQLILLRGASFIWNKHLVLGADIDLDPALSGTRVFTEAVIPVFRGVFDGRGHTIVHLTIKGETGLALFGTLWGEVKDLGIVDVNVIAGSVHTGALVGTNNGDVTRCYSTGSVSGSYITGGLVGTNAGSIAMSYSSASVSGWSHTGGLVGENSGGSIAASRSSGLVRGLGMCVGGLVGDNGGSIAVSYSEASVTGNGTYVGGLVGNNYGGSIVRSYSSGLVTYTANVGGVVGWGKAAKVMASFWDIETSGQATSAGGTGKTTAEMQTAKTFLEAGWDFVGETANGTEDIWKIAEGLDYPRLSWEPYDGRVTLELGQIFTVTLESNPSTGYRWEWVDHQDSIVEQMGEAQFKPRETGDPPLVGAGGWESFDFKAVHPGQMTLKLVYRRPWEEGVEPLKTFSLQVTVP